MPTKQISSRENATFKHWRKLACSARERRKSGRSLLDGPHLLEAFLAFKGRPEHVIVSESGTQNAEINRLLGRCAGVDVTQLSDALFAELSPVETPGGVLAEIAIPHSDALGHPEGFIVLLDEVQDPGNVGTIMRTAAAAGVNSVFLSRGCADAWSPKVLRAGMGAHFAVAVHERADLLEVLARYSGVSIATSLEASRSLYEIPLTGAVAFVVGNEGEGVSADVLAAVAHTVTIPMRGPMESLNASAAAAICLFEKVRQDTSQA